MVDKRKIVLGALASLLFSGIAGYYFKDWADRAKPRLFVSSIGFSGDVIELDQATIRTVNGAGWGDDISSFIAFERLIDFEKILSGYEQRIEQAVDSVKLWLDQNPVSETARQLTELEIKQTPYIQATGEAKDFTDVIGAAINGELRRKVRLTPPASLEKVELYPVKFPLYKEPGDPSPVVHFGREAVVFRYYDNFEESQRNTQNIIAEAFARGHGETIRWLHQYFINTAATDLKNIRDARSALRNALTAKAKIAVNLVVINTGQKPVVIQPFLRGQIRYGDDVFDSVFHVTMSDALDGSYSDRIKEAAHSAESGLNIKFEQFLPKERTAAYVTIPANGILSFSTTSDQSVGKNSDRFLDFFNVGKLEVVFSGRTADGVIINSSSSEIGRTISKKRYKELYDEPSAF